VRRACRWKGAHLGEAPVEKALPAQGDGAPWGAHGLMSEVRAAYDSSLREIQQLLLEAI